MKKTIPKISNEECFAYLYDVIAECEEKLKENPDDKLSYDTKNSYFLMFQALNIPMIRKKVRKAIAKSIVKDNWKFEPEGKHKKYLEELEEPSEGDLK